MGGGAGGSTSLGAPEAPLARHPMGWGTPLSQALGLGNLKVSLVGGVGGDMHPLAFPRVN